MTNQGIDRVSNFSYAILPMLIALLSISTSCDKTSNLTDGDVSGQKVQLDEVKFWCYNIQQVNTQRQHDQLVGSHFDMYVLEPTRSEKSESDFDIKGLISEIREYNKINYNKDPIILAYVDIGQAENWRWYWQNGWQIGNPEWIVGSDPNGWEGNYPVAYWHKTWEDIVIYGYMGKSFVEMTLKDGFDGIYMDWVEAFSDENVIDKAQAEGVNTGEKMFDFIEKIKNYARSESPNANPDYLIVAQNAPDLYDENTTRYVQLMDALAEEGVWYEGEADVDWYGSNGYNFLTQNWYPDWYTYVLETLPKIKGHMPVFCIEYAKDFR